MARVVRNCFKRYDPLECPLRVVSNSKVELCAAGGYTIIMLVCVTELS